MNSLKLNCALFIILTVPKVKLWSLHRLQPVRKTPSHYRVSMRENFELENEIVETEG